MGAFIQELIRSGNLVLFHDYRTGHCNDLSVNNTNNGVINGNCVWEGDGLRFVDATAYVEVPHDASLNLTNATFVMLKPKTRNYELRVGGFNLGMIVKDTGGAGTLWRTYLSGNRLVFDEGANARWSPLVYRDDYCYVALSTQAAAVAIGYGDGLSTGAFNAASTLSLNTHNVRIGLFAGVTSYTGTMQSVMIINRVLTAAEHARLYDELVNLTWPTRFYSYTKRTQAINRNEPGIIAGWHMRPAGGVIPDIVGASDGAIVGAPINEQGILGDRLLFDGVDDYINAGNVGTIKAVVFWTKPTTNTEDFLDLDGGTHTVEVAAGVVTATGWAAPTIFVDGVATTALLAGLRQRIVVSTATAFAANAVTLATETIFLEGTMGDVEFFSSEKDVGWALQDYLLGAKAIQLRSDWAYQVSPAAEGGIINQIIGTRGSILRAGDTGFRGFIEVEEVNGRLCKVIRCSTAGLLYIPMELAFDSSPTENAFGTWDFWAQKADASILDMNLISNLSTGITTGYGISWLADESVVVIEYGVGNVVAGGTASHSTWHRFRLTRSSAGLFTPYIDGVGFGAPAADLTTTTANYMLFDMDVNDRICLGNIQSDDGLKKMLGVVEAP